MKNEAEKIDNPQGNGVLQCVSGSAYVSKDLKNVICPQCKRPFKLTWNDYSDIQETLILRGCPSGGIYDVSIHCPYCDYEEDL